MCASCIHIHGCAPVCFADFANLPVLCHAVKGYWEVSSVLGSPKFHLKRQGTGRYSGRPPSLRKWVSVFWASGTPASNSRMWQHACPSLPSLTIAGGGNTTSGSSAGRPPILPPRLLPPLPPPVSSQWPQPLCLRSLRNHNVRPPVLPQNFCCGSDETQPDIDTRSGVCISLFSETQQPDCHSKMFKAALE